MIIVALCYGSMCFPVPHYSSHNVIYKVIVLMPCGFDAKQGKDHLARLMYKRGWDSLPGVDMNKVLVLDGNSYFSRSGPRLLDGLEIIFNIIHPDL